MTTVDTDDGNSSPAAPDSTPEGSRVTGLLLDALVVGLWFVAAGVIGGLVWVLVASPPKVTRAAGNASVSSEELVKQVGVDGWFLVIALVAGLASGVLLLAWRRRDPLVMVLLVVLGAGLASWVMIRVGQVAGPADELAALRKLPDGAHVLEQLRLHAPGVAWVWPIAAAFGAMVYLWVLAKSDHEEGEPG